MALTTAPGSPLDRLPDEILYQILFFAMESHVPFFLEYYLEAQNYAHTDYSKHSDSTSPENKQWPVHYRHSRITGYLKTGQCPTQVGHMADWLLVNTTNRRTRRLGKEVFFKAKVIVMTHSLPEKLRSGAVHDLVNPSDRAMVLEYASDVVFTPNNAYSAVAFAGLAKRLQAFPRLKTCTLLFGFQLADRPELVAEAVTGTAVSEGRTKMPKDFRQLLLDNGVPGHIELQVAVCRGTTWAAQRNILTKFVYPQLRVLAVGGTGQKAEKRERGKALGMGLANT